MQIFATGGQIGHGGRGSLLHIVVWHFIVELISLRTKSSKCTRPPL